MSLTSFSLFFIVLRQPFTFSILLLVLFVVVVVVAVPAVGVGAGAGAAAAIAAVSFCIRFFLPRLFSTRLPH